MHLSGDEFYRYYRYGWRRNLGEEDFDICVKYVSFYQLVYPHRKIDPVS
jgi:hypothetical protein